MAKFGDSAELVKCSFCGKSQKQVKKVIAGPGVYICDECIDLCNEIIEEEVGEATDLRLEELPKPREISSLLDFIMSVLRRFGFNDFEFNLSTRDPEKSVGSDEIWGKATEALREALDRHGVEYKIKEGDAAFYGPKIDIDVRDAIGRKWQLSTIQCDFNLPERFDLEYKGADNEMHRPVMIHRAPFGSMERFVAVLLEHCAGNFPLWLTPDQVVVLPISERFHDYAEQVVSLLEMSDIRALIDDRNEKIGRKIRDAEVKKIPFMIIVGEKEVESGQLSVRRHGQGDLGTFDIQAFSALVNEEISSRLAQF